MWVGFFMFCAFYPMKKFSRGWMHEVFVHFEEFEFGIAFGK